MRFIFWWLCPPIKWGSKWAKTCLRLLASSCNTGKVFSDFLWYSQVLLFSWEGMEVAKDSHLFWLDCYLMTFNTWGEKQCSSETSHPKQHFIGNRESEGPERFPDMPGTTGRAGFQGSRHPGHSEGPAWPDWASNLSALSREGRLAFVLLWQWSAFEIFLFLKSLPPACATRGTKPLSWSLWWFKTLWIDPVTGFISSWLIVWN